MYCIVDCRVDGKLANNFIELSLWGKPCYAYVVEAVRKAGCFPSIEVVTDSMRIKQYCEKRYPFAQFAERIPEAASEPIFVISGRAPCISADTIRDAVRRFNGHSLVSSRTEALADFSGREISFFSQVKQRKFNAFKISGGGVEERNYVFYPVKNNEAIVVNTDNDFELALVLKKKQENRPVVLQNIYGIIQEKRALFSNSLKVKSICLVGHSQLDQWNVEELVGYKVRNCAVSGISSFEYEELILRNNLLNCGADCFIIMHGTNDLVWDYTIEEIVESIRRNVEYIRNNNPAVPIIFLSCIHVNGRLDRSNARIDRFNSSLFEAIHQEVEWVDTSFMDDKYGTLKESYTKDGLHLSYEGYEALKSEIIRALKRVGL